MTALLENQQYSQFCHAVHRARLVLRYFREQRYAAVREYAGNHWSENSEGKKILLNMVSLYVRVVLPRLVAKDPRVQLSTFDRSSKAAVRAAGDWANEEIQHMELGDNLQRIVLDALFSVGIAKIALATPGDAASYAWQLKAGHPFLGRVDLDDFVFDTHGRDFHNLAFVGHRVRVPLEAARSFKGYDRKGRQSLVASNDEPYNLEGDQRINVLGRYFYDQGEEAEDMVDLWEIYRPRHRDVLTLTDDQLTGAGGVWSEPLQVQKWMGPSWGPYLFLSYGTIPGNAMPKGPIMDILDLNVSINNHLRKIDRESERYKRVIAAAGTEGDAQRLIDANDGDVVPITNPERLVPIDQGGPNQVMVGIVTFFKDLLSWAAGNLDIMGGLSPQSKTATQDTMLNQNSSATVNEMQRQTVTFTARCLRSLLWYWWHHPSLHMETEYTMPGMDASAVLTVTPGHRQGKEMPRIKVDPYSLVYQTPQSRLSALTQFVQQNFLPAAQLAMQQGIQLDWNAYFTKIGEYLDDPDVADLLTLQEPPQAMAGPSEGQSMGTPQETTRNYVRENRSGRTEKGNTLNMMNAMMGIDGGGASQPEQALMMMG